MDTSYPIDLGALFDAVRTHDHLIFRFSTVDERLFVDFRAVGEVDPAALVLPPADNVRQRLASIAAARPGLPRPERLYVVAWPLRVRGLDRLGVLAAIRERLADLDAFAALAALDAAFARLEAAEREELRRAIVGEGYRTLWPAGAPHQA